MYAVIRTGGKQYRVEAGDLLRVEKINRTLGEEFDVTDVLLVGGDRLFVGQPNVGKAKVTVVVTRQAQAPKILVFKKKRRQGYRKMQGHRQLFTELFVKSITSPEGEVSKANGEAPVLDPAKREARLKRRQEERATGASKAGEASGEKRAAPKKAAAKKKTKKKAVKKKAKKTAKKAKKKS